MSTVSWLRQLFIVVSSPEGNPGEAFEVQCSQPGCSKRYLLKRGWSGYAPLLHHAQKSHGLTPPATNRGVRDPVDEVPASEFQRHSTPIVDSNESQPSAQRKQHTDPPIESSSVSPATEWGDHVPLETVLRSSEWRSLFFEGQR